MVNLIKFIHDFDNLTRKYENAKWNKIPCFAMRKLRNNTQDYFYSLITISKTGQFDPP